MLFPTPSWLYNSWNLSWISAEALNLPVLCFSFKNTLCFWFFLFLFLKRLKFSLIEGVPLYDLYNMCFLHLNDFVDVDIVNGGMNFTFHKLSTIILFYKSFPFLFWHCNLFWKSLLPKKAQCHIVSVGNDII